MIPLFQITKATPAILKSKTSRDEKHGNDQVPAISLRWLLKVPNTWLDLLSPGLCEVFYGPGDDAQATLPGTERIALTKLRTTAIGALEVHNAYKLCKVGVIAGIDTRPLQFADCKVDKFKVVAMHEGGSIDLELRIGTSDITASSAGRLVMMTVDSTHELLIDVPEQDEDAPQPQPTKEEADAKIKEEGPTPIEALAAAVTDEDRAAIGKAASKLGRKVAAQAKKAERPKVTKPIPLPKDQQPKHKPRTEAQKAARKAREQSAKATLQ